MKKILVWLPVLMLAACSSSPPSYEKMRTADDALNKYDQNQVKDGMAITKKGAVIDIKTEEIQAQKNRLVLENEEKDRKIETLNDRIKDLEQDIMALRVALGLPAQKPKAQGKCCTSDGKMIPGTVKAAPTLEEELASVKKRKGASTEEAKEERSED
jgi:hypothetical protein